MLNLIHHHLFNAIWILWLAYWFVAARGVKAVQRRESGWSRLAHFGPMAVAAWMLAADHLPGAFLEGRIWPSNEWTFWAGIGLLLLGLWFAVWARRVIGRNWSGSVTVKEDHELVRSGPYAFVRHPIYTGLLLGLLGSALPRGEWRGLVAVLIMALALWRKLKLEERWMGETFGARYAAYKGEVKALVPYLL